MHHMCYVLVILLTIRKYLVHNSLKERRKGVHYLYVTYLGVELVKRVREKHGTLRHNEQIIRLFAHSKCDIMFLR